jgi:hypothetical protein
MNIIINNHNSNPSENQESRKNKEREKKITERKIQERDEVFESLPYHNQELKKKKSWKKSTSYTFQTPIHSQ